MDSIKIEPFCDAASEQRENLLYLLGRMRQIQAASAQPQPGLGLPGLLKRAAGPAEDQPLDFSAPAKHPRLSPDLLYPRHNKHDSLGSDGVSDVSSHSPGSHSEDPRPGSTSPLPPHVTSELPSLSIPSPNDTADSGLNKSSDLLTTAAKFPMSLKPLASLTEAEEPAAARLPVTLPLPFPQLPVFPQSLKQPAFPPSLQFPFPPVAPAHPATEINKLSADSQEKYAEFREKMMKNMESAKVGKNRSCSSVSAEDTNSSLDLTSGSMGGGPQHHSTPTRGEAGGKDAAYWERRRKNNEAAKRSRDARRQKENEIAVRASFLEQENIQLKMELVQLRTELGAMRDQVTRRPLTLTQP